MIFEHNMVGTSKIKVTQPSAIRTQLERFMPLRAVNEVAKLLQQHPIHLAITMPRKNILGAFYPVPQSDKRNKIRINGDLNSFEFLATFLHEYAHLICRKKYGDAVATHGKEWKKLYEQVALPFLRQGIFPEDVTRLYYHYFSSRRLNDAYDVALNQALKKCPSRSAKQPTVTPSIAAKVSAVPLRNPTVATTPKQPTTTNGKNKEQQLVLPLW
ncbi:hypothetical protein FACS1894201_08580 [Bacteroidia bacterium]|nr:hypothetical protein FACS1894201_08580 [Bacteroidia bacterium]